MNVYIYKNMESVAVVSEILTVKNAKVIFK